MRPDGFNRSTDPGHFMTGQIVQDDSIARAERGGQDLFDLGHEARAIDRAVEDGRRGELVRPQGGNDRRGLPVAVGDFRHQAGSTPTAAIATGHLRLERRLV